MCTRCGLFRRIIFAAAVGTVITVATAWIAMFVPTGNDWHGPPTVDDVGLAREPGSVKIWQISRGRNGWHEVISYWHMQISGMSFMIPDTDFEARKFDYRTLPPRFRPESLDDLKMQAWYHVTGFPFGAMSCSVHWNTQISNADIIYDVYGGVQLPRDADFNPRALPLTPVWPGFLADVALLGSAWFAFMWWVRKMRMRARARQNLCMKCRYPRTGLPAESVCPECGLPPSAPNRQTKQS